MRMGYVHIEKCVNLYILAYSAQAYSITYLCNIITRRTPEMPKAIAIPNLFFFNSWDSKSISNEFGKMNACQFACLMIFYTTYV